MRNRFSDVGIMTNRVLEVGYTRNWFLEVGVIRNRVLEVGHVRNLFWRPVPFEIVFWMSVAWETGFRRSVSSEIVFWGSVTYDFVCLRSGHQKSFERNSRTKSILTFGNSKLQPKKRYAEKLRNPQLSGRAKAFWHVCVGLACEIVTGIFQSSCPGICH